MRVGLQPKQSLCYVDALRHLEDDMQRQPSLAQRCDSAHDEALTIRCTESHVKSKVQDSDNIYAQFSVQGNRKRRLLKELELIVEENSVSRF